MNKKLILRVIKLLYDEYIIGEGWDPMDLTYDTEVYESVYEYISKHFGFERSDWESIDYIYAAFAENSILFDDQMPNITLDNLKLPEKKKYSGKHTYYATVKYTELYTLETYLPVILKQSIREYQINEDSIDTDIIETWDDEIDIK